MVETRVHQLASELGVTSRDLMLTVGEIGEHVPSPSSILDPSVEREHEIT